MTKKTQITSRRSKAIDAGVVVEGQTAEEILKTKQASKLTEEELHILLDAGLGWQDAAKQAGDFVTKIKNLIKEYAELNDVSELETDKAKCKIGPTTKTITGTIKDFIKILVAEGKKHLHDEVLTVSITNAKKYLGEDALKGWMKTETNKFGSVSIKRK